MWPRIVIYYKELNVLLTQVQAVYYEVVNTRLLRAKRLNLETVRRSTVESLRTSKRYHGAHRWLWFHLRHYCSTLNSDDFHTSPLTHRGALQRLCHSPYNWLKIAPIFASESKWNQKWNQGFHVLFGCIMARSRVFKSVSI